MLDWTMMDLANAAGVSISIAKRVERSLPQPVSGNVDTVIRRAMEAVGVVFLPDDGDGLGIKLRPLKA